MIKRAGRYFDHALIAAFPNDKLKTSHQAGPQQPVVPDIELEKTK